MIAGCLVGNRFGGNRRDFRTDGERELSFELEDIAQHAINRGSVDGDYLEKKLKDWPEPAVTNSTSKDREGS